MTSMTREEIEAKLREGEASLAANNASMERDRHISIIVGTCRGIASDLNKATAPQVDVDDILSRLATAAESAERLR